MILFLLLLLSILGHGYLVVAVINRLHGLASSKKIINILTRILFAVFFSAPIVVGWNWADLDLADWTSLSLEDSWLKKYILFCSFWGALKLIKRSIGERGCNHKDTLQAWNQQQSNFSQHLDSSEHIGEFSKKMAKLPFNQSLQLMIDRKRLKLPRLQKVHEGLKIIHISDLHMTGRIGKGLYSALVEQINALEPDVIAITGDIIENNTCEPWLSETLVHLKARYGTYFLLGNHDYYIDTEITKNLLQQAGMHYVARTPLRTEWNNHPVILAGNELPWGIVSDVSGLDEQSEEIPFMVFLLHSPDQFRWACMQNADLALAGHTHGGQFRFPLLGPIVCPSLYGTRYACGVFRKNNTVMHVTRGVSGKLPLRWNCPPEIAVLELARS